MRNLNKTEWLVLSIILLVVFGTLSNWYECAVYGMYAALTYLLGFTLVMIYNAIKNTIKEL